MTTGSRRRGRQWVRTHAGAADERLESPLSNLFGRQHGATRICCIARQVPQSMALWVHALLLIDGWLSPGRPPD